MCSGRSLGLAGAGGGGGSGWGAGFDFNQGGHGHQLFLSGFELFVRLLNGLLGPGRVGELHQAADELAFADKRLQFDAGFLDAVAGAQRHVHLDGAQALQQPGQAAFGQNAVQAEQREDFFAFQLVLGVTDKVFSLGADEQGFALGIQQNQGGVDRGQGAADFVAFLGELLVEALDLARMDVQRALQAVAKCISNWRKRSLQQDE